MIEGKIVRGFKVALCSEDGSMPPGFSEVAEAIQRIDRVDAFKVVLSELDGKEADRMFDPDSR